MHREQLVQQALRTISSPWYVGAVAALVSLSLASGFLSLRILRRMPDFPRKRDMIWGARWCWALELAVFLCAYAVAYLGITRTDYLLTAFVASGAFPWLALPALQLALPRQFYGDMLWIAALASRVRRRPLDIEAWLTKLDRSWSRTWLNCSAVFAYLALVFLMVGYIALAFTYPFDVDAAAQFRAQDVADELGLAMRGTTIGRRIQKVEAFVPSTEPDWLEHGGELEAVKWSLRRIFGRAEPPQNEHRVLIRVTKDSTQTQKREVLAQAQNLLADRHEPHRWRIAVYSRESKLSVHGWYPPTEGDE
ncbi:MAG: hypothetical protein ACE149_05210 [Armatimonadota bacterium]